MVSPLRKKGKAFQRMIHVDLVKGLGAE